MSILRLLTPVILLLSLAAILTSCGSKSPAPNTLEKVELSTTNQYLKTNTTAQIYATGIYSDKTTTDLSNQVTWKSSNTSLATVDAQGKVTALAVGTVTITAILNGKGGAIGFEITAPQLTSIAITPNISEIASGIKQQFTATGLYDDGVSQDITGDVTWSSLDPSIVSINTTTPDKGLATGIATSGSTTIEASHNGVTGSTTVTATAATLISLEIGPANFSQTRNTGRQLYATGVFSDDSILDLTEQVSWSTDQPAIATLSANGWLDAKAVGNIQISASLSGQSASIAINVIDIALSRIEITPSNSSNAAGSLVQLSATGIYTDNSSQDLTDQVTWESSNTSIATIGNTVLNRGLAKAVTPGSSTITAYYHGTSGQTTFTVTSATLSTIEISPNNPSIAKGTQQKFSATGYYSDGSTKDITDQVIWSSSDAAIASSATGAGTFNTHAAGAIQVNASLGAVSGYTPLTVTAATLTSIAISPTSPSIAKGSIISFTATGTYTDASTQDITNQVVWSSSDTTIASISNAAGTEGKATAILQGGPVTIQATLGAISDSATLTVTTASLASITVTSPNPTILKGTQLALTATGTYTDATTQIITTDVTWSSSDATIISVDNTSTGKGIITAHGAGAATISVSLGGITGTSSNITVDTNPNTPKSLSITATPNMILNNGTDSTTIEVTLQPADASGVIANNTNVAIEVLNGATLIDSATLLTTDGKATYTLASTTTGFVSFKATISVNGISVSKTSHILSTANFGNAIARAGFNQIQYDIDGTTILSGSWIGFAVKNYSNRALTIDSFQVQNGAAIELDAPGTGISGGTLGAGEVVSIKANFTAGITDSGITGTLNLYDSVTGAFSIVVTFTP